MRRMWLMSVLITTCLGIASGETVPSEQTVVIRLDAGSNAGAIQPVWNYFGCDEPNYTCAANGTKLLRELAAISPAPVYIRTHNLLTSGDGTPAPKWGSTNAYSENGSGKPIYDWTILDRILDNFRAGRVKPLVEIGFMPEAMSVKPAPYRHHWPSGELFTGWSYPPKDYGKWAALVNQWVLHEIERYGRQEVESWPWEVWNEPDIAYWHGTPEEYFKLYDYTADAVKRALPAAPVGGPESTGPAGRHAAEFLRAFLEHCSRGTNYATGKTGAPLDFISFHPKGAPRFVDGHVRMGMANQLRAIDKGFEIVSSFPRYRSTPIILGESDPEGCAACPARQHPENAYRNGPLYAAYEMAMLKNTIDLASQHGCNLRGIVTWAFEFEDQPYFEGFRALATNGIDKPVLNAFRMFGHLSGHRLATESSGARKLREMVASGVRTEPCIDVLATEDNGRIAVLVWNYHDDDVAAPDANVAIAIDHLLAPQRNLSVRHWRIDRDHSNAFEAWKKMGSPQQPSPAQYSQLEAAGKLQELKVEHEASVTNGSLRIQFPLPREAVSLLELKSGESQHSPSRGRATRSGYDPGQ